MATHEVQPNVSSTAPRFAVIGAGGMGTLIASVLGRLAPVVLVCRNEERAAKLFRFGAKCDGQIQADSRPIVVRTLHDILAAGGASHVFVATKTTAIPQLAEELKGLLGTMTDDPRGPMVVSFQNGIDPGRELMQRLGHHRVVRMVLTLGASVSADGSHVDVTMNQPPHAIGSLDPELRQECDSIAQFLTKGGLETENVDDIESAVWRKGIVNAAVNPVAALVNCSVGDVLDSPSRVLVERMIQEGIRVAEVEDIALPEGYAERVAQLLEQTRRHVPSMVTDIRNGRESEIGQLNRQIMEHGRIRGVPTPTHDLIDALIETFDWKVYRT